ncbi:MAG: hypothetical protein VX834_04955 [Myxococcota bacterium]|nr:hypothetical protein [Myxococcota bacterium]
MRLQRVLSVVSFGMMLGVCLGTPAVLMAADKEQVCDDRKDDDGDGMVDCADADCIKTDACKPDGEPENTDARCSDWLDNDENGAIDCDDQACKAPNIKACMGSWELPEADSQSVDVATVANDIDGERNDIVCSDGLDNDGDGFVDCADLGCRASEEVTVCRGGEGLRFGSFGRFNVLEHNIEEDRFDTKFEELSVRALGSVPMLQDSFFMLKMRLEKTPKLVWFILRAPIGEGHYFSFRSGGMSISSGDTVSNAKQLLLERAYYMSNAYGLGDAASLVLDGYIPGMQGQLKYGVGLSGGTGRFFAVGGRYYPDEQSKNYSFSVAGALQYTPIGYWSIYNSPYIYTPTSTVLNFDLSGSYVQAVQERFPAVASRVLFRTGYVHVDVEGAFKRELNYESNQYSYKVQAGLLLWPKRMMVAADHGGFRSSGFERTIENIADATEDSLIPVTQTRAALHYYFWRHIGVATILYDHKVSEGANNDGTDKVEHSVSLQMRYQI